MYYDHITALRLRLGRWSEGRELKGFEREVQVMAEQRGPTAPTRHQRRRRPFPVALRQILRA